MILDEADVAKLKCIKVLVDSLDTVAQMKHLLLKESHLKAVAILITVCIILHTVGDVLRQLRTKPENFAFLLTDAALHVN